MTSRRMWLRFAAAATLTPVLVRVSASAAPLEEVAARVKRSVVAVGTFLPTRSPAFLFSGTGFAIGDGTVIATNAHVVPPALDAERREALVALLPGGDGGGERRPATVVAMDREHDLALLRISGAPLPSLTLSSRDSVPDGQSAAFTGFPIGAVLGVIPATHRATVAATTPIVLPGTNAAQLDERVVRRLQTPAMMVLQLDATAYPGNSGSPLYDATSGDVLGIVNLVFVKGTKEAALAQPSGISFAIPARHLIALLALLK